MMRMRMTLSMILTKTISSILLLLLVAFPLLLVLSSSTTKATSSIGLLGDQDGHNEVVDLEEVGNNGKQSSHHHHQQQQQRRETTTKTQDDITLGMLNGGSSFFEPVKEGFMNKCAELGINCFVEIENRNITGDNCESHQYVIDEFIELGVQGIAMKPCNEYNIESATMEHIPVLTFDGDFNETQRAAYVGTDQYFMGKTMARLLRQLRPEGGTFVIVAPKTGRAEGFTEEIMKNNHRDDRAHWYPLEDPNEATRPFFKEKYPNYKYFEEMSYWAKLNPTAIIMMKQSPMKPSQNYTQFVDENRHRDITLIGVDGADYQLAHLHSRYIDGLIGQLPYEFGTVAASKLYELAKNNQMEFEDGTTTIPTNLVAYNLIPIELPTLELDYNLIGNLKYIGYVCFSIVAFLSLMCIGWTVYHRKDSLVVKAAQPFFLLMIATGVLVMAGSLIPLSFDDGGEPNSVTERYSVAICMSVPWLAFTGFTIVFAALFSKTWRVNKLFGASEHFTRVKLRERDVLAPFAVLFVCNIVVLICWTVIDPLKYERQLYVGTDFWNREIASYGACQSNNVAPYIVPLALVNLVSLAIACWQAYKARSIQSEFSEAKYIGLTVSSMFQAFLTGIPIVVVVRDMPEAYYLVMTFMIFVLCMAVLLLIFLPKYFSHRSYTKLTPSDQRKVLMARSVRKSVVLDASSIPPAVVLNSNGSNPIVKDRSILDGPDGGTDNDHHPEGKRISDIKTGHCLSSSSRKTDGRNTSGHRVSGTGGYEEKTISEITMEHPSVQFKLAPSSPDHTNTISGDFGGVFDGSGGLGSGGTGTAPTEDTTTFRPNDNIMQDEEMVRTPTTSVRSRMEELESIKEFISHEEYNKKKQEILDSI